MEAIIELLHELESKLKSLPADAHWFCPRRDDHDEVDYENPDEPEEAVTVGEKQDLIAAAQTRFDDAYNFCLLFGLAREEAEPWWDWFSQRFNGTLTSCDKCVRNYHMGRRRFLQKLLEELDEEQVQEIGRRIDAIDLERIRVGVARAKALLEGVPEEERTQGKLASDPASLIAVYEAICCKAWLRKEGIESHTNFDFVFRTIQRRKTLKLGDVLPAMTFWLFSADQTRRNFALASWQRLTQNLTAATFEYAVRDLLMSAIPAIANTSNLEDAQRLWECLLLVLSRLDGDLITHSLAAMECVPDVYHLAIQHLPRANDTVLRLIIKTLCILVQKAPKTFWGAYGTISPSSVADLIVGSPDYTTTLSQLAMEVAMDGTEKPVATMWVNPFLQSLAAAQQYELCRSLLHQFLTRLPNDPKANDGLRFVCSRAAFEALVLTLSTFLAQDYHINNASSLVIVNNALGLVAEHRDIISRCANVTPDELDAQSPLVAELSRLAMLVWRNSVALIGKMLNAQYRALTSANPFNFESQTLYAPLWESILESMQSRNLVLAENVLEGIGTLTGLDKVKTKKGISPSREEAKFNEDVGKLFDDVAIFLERLSDYKPEAVAQLCGSREKAISVLVYLAPPTQPLYEAAVELVKTVTREDDRRSAISMLLQQHFVNTLLALAHSAHVIGKAGSFGSWPYLLKTNREVVTALCDPQSGILRSRTTFEGQDSHSISRWWTYQWKALSLAFEKTESWSLYHAQEMMMNFCRDAMDYAQILFDQYSVLASALESALPKKDDAAERSSTRKTRETLLEQPKHALFHMAKWVRLRDEYLATTIVSLVCKLLRRLGEFDMEIDDKTKDYLDRAISGRMKTKLTRQQIAELKKAMDEHFGIEEIEALPAIIRPTKQGTIDAWSRSGDAQSTTSEKGIAGHIGREMNSLTKTLEKKSSVLDQMRARQTVTVPVVVEKKKPNLMSLKESRQREKDEKRKRDAMQIAKAQALRGGPGHVSGEGSGLKGIGIQGKDHAPRSEIMINSDSDSTDSDDDEEEDSKAFLNKHRQASKQVAEYQESKRRAYLEQQAKGPVRKQKIVRSAKDMRARLVPNMDSLHSIILGWEIFHEGDSPPNIDIHLRVEDTYRAITDYTSTYTPLLIMEAWRSFITARDENNAKCFSIKVANRMSVDRYVEVSTTMTPADNKEVSIGEGDIILLSKGENPLLDKDQPHCLSRVFRITRKKDVIEVSYRIGSGNNPLISSLAPSSKIRGVKITSMITIEREYAALLSLQYYDLMQEVLDAKPSPILKYRDERLAPYITNYSVNKGQAKAILSASENDGFTLIQGPPGSGKTKTIVAMVGSLLTTVLRTAKDAAGGVAIGRPVGAAPEAKSIPKKLLVCAPSNAAVDELVMRLKQGVKDENGQFHKIGVIRLGRSEAINAAVRDVTLDELVAARLEADSRGKANVQSVRDKLHQEAGRLKEELAALRPQLEEARAKSDNSLAVKLQREFDLKKREQARIGSRIDEEKESGNTAARENEINRRRIQQEIINSAHVLCSTLSGSAHDMFKNLDVEFETVIIDEAAQCIELSALIPLKYGATKCILVGDPKQLPPTVLSQVAAKFGYEQSLFVRMQRQHPDDVHLLDTQYRMHPEISKFPSQTFYDSKLIDGDKMAELQERPWHESSLLGPYRFFNVRGTQVAGKFGHSFTNVEEINLAMMLYTRITTDYRSCKLKGKVGIITPYKAQLRELRVRFQQRFGEQILDDVDFNTTDAFQGREAEIIIFSCVRARAKGGIGFLDDIRRMNVGLTRAKSSMWVLGDANALMQGEFWAKLVNDAKTRGLFTDGDVLSLLRRPLPKDRMLATPSGAGAGASPENGDAMDWAPTTNQNSGRSTPAVEPKLSNVPQKDAEGYIHKRERGTESPDGDEPSRKKRPASTDREGPADPPQKPQENVGPQPAAPLDGRANGPGPSKPKNGKNGAVPAPPPLALMKPTAASKGPTIIDPHVDDDKPGNSARPSRPAPAPPRVPIPRRKAPADPFIRRKPNKPR